MHAPTHIMKVEKYCFLQRENCNLSEFFDRLQIETICLYTVF